MAQSYHTLSAEPMQYTIFTRVFGGKDSVQLKRKLETSWKDLLKPIEDMFLNDAAAIAAISSGGIPSHVNELVTLDPDVKKLQRWEASAEAKIVGQGPSNATQAVEANLQSILRDLGACVAIPLLYGQDFLSRYSSLLDDFWRFDNEVFPLLMIGIPPWIPLRIVRKGVEARARLLQEMAALYRRIDQHQRGVPVEDDADMSDISNAALERSKVYSKRGWSFEERGGGDLAILWGQNANTQPIFFWLLLYVYSTPSILERLRGEVQPYVTLNDTNPSRILSIDYQGLFGGCAFMRACIFETYRMANEATSIRYVHEPITLQDGDIQHILRPGMFVSAPHSVNQRDPSIYANPDQFIPDRFLETNSESGKTFARYGKLRPWGVGAAMCKGRSFAEKEIMALSAAVISVWDIHPATGEWQIPAMLPGTGVKKPAKDVRVRIQRRQLNETK